MYDIVKPYLPPGQSSMFSSLLQSGGRIPMVVFAIFGVLVWQLFLKEGAYFRRSAKKEEEFESTGNKSKDMLRKFAQDAAK